MLIKILGYIVGLPLLLILGILVVLEAGDVFNYAKSQMYFMMDYLIGFAGMSLLMAATWRWTVRLRTLSHELCHAAVCILFGQKVKDIDVNGDGSGLTTYEAGRIGDIFIALAPYCLPLFTYVALFIDLGFSDEQNKMYFNWAIGATYAWHVICGLTQMGPYQTDIKNESYIVSYTFIAIFCIFNLYVVLLSVQEGILVAFKFLAVHFIEDLPRALSLIATALHITAG